MAGRGEGCCGWSHWEGGNRGTGEGKTFPDIPNLEAPNCSLKVPSAVGCQSGAPILPHTVAKKGLGRAWWLRQGWRGWRAGEGLWGRLGGYHGLWLSMGPPLAWGRVLG